MRDSLVGFQITLLFDFRFYLFCPPSKRERRKLSAGCALCVFLGYGIHQKGYRCYDPVTKSCMSLVKYCYDTKR